MQSSGVRVFVNNLSYQTTWQGLKDHFAGVGKVLFADVIMVRLVLTVKHAREYTNGLLADDNRLPIDGKGREMARRSEPVGRRVAALLNLRTRQRHKPQSTR